MISQMRRTLPRLWKKDTPRERHLKETEEEIKPGDWTQAEIARRDRILTTLRRLQRVLPTSKGENEEARKLCDMIQEVEQENCRLIDAMSQDKHDALKLGNQEATLKTLTTVLEGLAEKMGCSYIQEAYLILKREQEFSW
jgi:hypothetical protein